jgi:hypothetical protein
MNSDVKLAIDSQSQQYYERFLKPWEDSWRKGEKPIVMSDEEEIRASSVLIAVD